MKRYALSVLFAGSILAAGCHSQRLAVVPMTLPRLLAATPPDSAVAAAGLPSPRQVAAETSPRQVARRHRPRTVAGRQLVFIVRPMAARLVSKRPLVSPTVAYHDPRPEHFLPLATWLTIGATLLLGLLVVGVIAAPLPLNILLGLLALVVLAIDVFAISLLVDGLDDQQRHRRKR